MCEYSTCNCTLCLYFSPYVLYVGVSALSPINSMYEINASPTIYISRSLSILVHVYLTRHNSKLRSKHEIAKKKSNLTSYNPTQSPIMCIYDRSKYAWAEIHLDCDIYI